MEVPWSLELGAWGFAVALLLFCCALLTLRQVQYWRNSETLFTHAVQVTKNNYLAYNNLGFYQSAAGKTATLGFLVGQVMKKSGGQAVPQVVQELLREALEQQAGSRP